MGARGPVPNRSDDLARPRSRKGGEHTGKEVSKGELRPVVIPDPDPTWHDIARMLWDSLSASGQSDFYQQSDWAFAYSLCDDLSHYKKPFVTKDGIEYTKRSGQMLQTIYSAMSDLLVTEAHRRRVSIELNAPEPDVPTASVTAIADYKARLSSVPDSPDDED